MLKKHSVVIAGHATSLTLEPLFWQQLQLIAQQRGLSINQLITEIDDGRRGNLSSTLRVYVLQHALSGSASYPRNPQADFADDQDTGVI